MSENELSNLNQINPPNSEEEEQIKTKDNILYTNIHLETKKISLYLDESINNFHLLFQNNLKDFDDVLKYLKTIDITNKCICASYLENGWVCRDCSKVNNSVICNTCYKNTKYLHKGHNVLYNFDGAGMCDCGDPNVLKTFCPEHKGPLKDKNEINDYITKVFNKDIIYNLKNFFDEFFSKFSEYLILTEKCEYFFNDKFKEDFAEKNSDEKDDIILLKKNFNKLFMKLIDFLMSISEHNFGMFNLISMYFLNNHL